MPRVRWPKRGSKAFSPRKRAKRIGGRIDFWPESEDGPRLLGFAGYKAGMTHVFLIEDRDRVPEYGSETRSPATVVDAPPMTVIGVRAYEKTVDGLKAITEAWVKDIPADILRAVKTHGGEGQEESLKRIEAQGERIAQISIVAATQPRLATVSKKKPDIMEIAIGGGTKAEQLKYAGGLLGRTVSVSDIFSTGESIDVIGVTKGKGFQGPVKRWGVRILQNKSRKTVRGVATLGGWSPRRVLPTVPRAGQMGFHNRTEYNKRILLMGSDGEKVTPRGGFNRYGEVRSDYILLKGSVMGPPKRLIKLRKAARRSRYPKEPPQVTYISTEFLKKAKEG